jgi:hypothetical protein
MIDIAHEEQETLMVLIMVLAMNIHVTNLTRQQLQLEKMSKVRLKMMASFWMGMSIIGTNPHTTEAKPTEAETAKTDTKKYNFSFARFWISVNNVDINKDLFEHPVESGFVICSYVIRWLLVLAMIPFWMPMSFMEFMRLSQCIPDIQLLLVMILTIVIPLKVPRWLKDIKDALVTLLINAMMHKEYAYINTKIVNQESIITRIGLDLAILTFLVNKCKGFLPSSSLSTTLVTSMIGMGYLGEDLLETTQLSETKACSYIFSLVFVMVLDGWTTKWPNCDPSNTSLWFLPASRCVKCWCWNPNTWNTPNIDPIQVEIPLVHQLQKNAQTFAILVFILNVFIIFAKIKTTQQFMRKILKKQKYLEWKKQKQGK